VPEADEKGMRLMRNFLLTICALALMAGPAHAYEFTRSLKRADTGADVRALQIRIAGWYPNADQTHFEIDGVFGRQTAEALKAFEAHHDLRVDGIAGKKIYALLGELEDDDGSTAHFKYSEFKQNYNPQCSTQANSYAGTFKGGPARAWRVRRNVRWLMWRLEALRAKLGDHAIGISSGFRSIAYNRCIGGASKSQHLYGSAADLRVAETNNRDVRDAGKGAQLHGIACYSSFRHNHLDIRLDNPDLKEAWYWYWPKENNRGQHLAEDGKVCWGEVIQNSVASVMSTMGATTEALSEWAETGEPSDLHGLD